MLARGMLPAPFDCIDQVKWVACPEYLDKMQGLRHGGNVIQAAMESIVDAASRCTVSCCEGMFKLSGQQAQFGNVLGFGLFDGPPYQLCFEQQPQLQDFCRRAGVKRDYL